ncbi:MAG: response regulator [Thermodesulfobacteriota bacterium]
MVGQTNSQKKSQPPVNRKTILSRGLGRTLMSWFLIFSLIPLCISTFAGYYNARNSLKTNAYNALKAATELKTSYINSYFSRLLIDLDNQAQAKSNVQLLAELAEAYRESGNSLEDFVKSFQWELIVHEKASDLITFASTYHYLDVLLLDAEGNLLFSVHRHSDFGTNLFIEGEETLKHSLTEALSTGRPVFSDFFHHIQAENPAAGCLSTVLLDENGEKIGLIALEISLNEIDNIMQQKAGLGESGESFLIGSDLKMRSNSRLSEQATILGEPVDTDQTRNWLEFHGAPGSPFQHSHDPSIRYLNHGSVQVYGTHETIEVGGVRLGVIAEIEVEEALRPVMALGLIAIVLFVLTVVVVIFTAVLTTQRIVKPLMALTAGAKRISGGNLKEEIDISAHNEIGELADSFNLMLGSLRETREKTIAQDWLKTGQAELNEAMRGEQGIGTLGEHVIRYLAEFFNAQIGAIYVCDDEDNFRMIGSYAYDMRKNLSNAFRQGDGLVGQAALEQKPIVITNCPKDYISIRSGLGDAVPCNIIVYPLLKDDVTIGVIELGSFDVFSHGQIEFLDEVARAIGTTLNGVRAQVQTKKLLKETQQQSTRLQTQQEELTSANEQLQAQQEELKTANEELQEQTLRLRASEESLQSQQEELQVTNEELEEKNKLLERQTEEVEQARLNIEEKAAQLGQASMYKSQFLANMSHELRSPLNSLLLLADSLKQNKESNLNSDEVESASIIYDSGNELLSLINEILDLSKIEAGRMDLNLEGVKLSELAHSIHNSFGHLAKEKGLGLNIQLAEGISGEIITDRQRLEQILKNLVSNAVKFTEQGHVTVTFDRPDSGVELNRPGLRAGQVIAVSIVDTGIGLEIDKQKMIFEAFQQVDGTTARRYGGTGLGLTISRELARLLGGEIRLESKLGKGSTFTLYLPFNANLVNEEEVLQIEKVAQLLTPSQSPSASRHRRFDDDRNSLEKGQRVMLIIEDDEKFAAILYQHAHDHDFRCLVALTGEEGLSLAKKHMPTAISLDLRLPGIDGWTVLGKLKDDPQTRHIPVHIISVEKSDAESRRRGAIGHLTKPVSHENLENVFKRIEESSSQKLKRLLIVEEDQSDRQAIVELLSDMDVIIDQAESGQEVLDSLHERKYDCIILDLNLTDMSGDELLKRLFTESEVEIPPVIVHTASELSREHEIQLREYASTIVLKDAKSQERLLDEVSLFLHSVVSDMSVEKQQIIASLHDTDDMLVNRKVLVVDDDMRTVFALTRLLSSYGINALKAEDGRKALEILDREPDIELVLTDIMMPDVDGYETIKRIRAQQRFRKLPIIALTAKAMKEDREHCFAVGASDYLPKPVDQERLLSMLRVWLYR